MYQPNDFPPAHNQGVGAPPNSTGQKALLGQKTKEVAKNVGKVLVTILFYLYPSLYPITFSLNLRSHIP